MKQNKCIDCKKPITYNALRCSSCHNKNKMKSQNVSGIFNPNYKDGSWCNKHYCIDCHIEINYRTWKYGTKRCIKCTGKFYSNKNRWNWKGGKPKCKKCGKLLACYTSIYCNDCKGNFISTWRKRNYRGKNNPVYGKVTKAIRLKYKSIWFRSTWEANFAKWCDLSGIKWKYESKTFDLEDITYTPDFYLPEYDYYIEIKGWWKKIDLIKKKKLKNLFPNIKIKYYTGKTLKQMSIL